MVLPYSTDRGRFCTGRNDNTVGNFLADLVCWRSGWRLSVRSVKGLVSVPTILALIACAKSPPLRRAAGAWDAHRSSFNDVVPEAPRDVASYTLDVRLARERHLIEATGTVRWVNTSQVPVTELW